MCFCGTILSFLLLWVVGFHFNHNLIIYLWHLVFQLLLRSKTRYFSRGSIIADSKEDAKGLIVITAGQVKLIYIIKKILAISYCKEIYSAKSYVCRWVLKFQWTQRMLIMQIDLTMEGPCYMCSSAGNSKNHNFKSQALPEYKFDFPRIHIYQ